MAVKLWMCLENECASSELHEMHVARERNTWSENVSSSFFFSSSLSFLFSINDFPFRCSALSHEQYWAPWTRVHYAIKRSRLRGKKKRDENEWLRTWDMLMCLYKAFSVHILKPIQYESSLIHWKRILK